MFTYSFPAVKGVQAYCEYYISMVPCKLLKKIFSEDNNYVLPEYRAQRKLNYNRIPEIRDYILNNRDSYVFSALTASIDGSFSFVEIAPSIGTIEVEMDSVFLINDGQHRNSAIQAAIETDSSIGEETIPIVFFVDKGLKRSQQMFTDLNKYAVKPSKSQNTFYDSKDPLSVLSRNIIENNRFLRNYTDVENDTLGKYSAKLFTLNSFYTANKMIIGSRKLTDDLVSFCEKYWNFIVENIVEWKMLDNKELTKKSLREDYIITQNVVLYAFGKLGSFFLNNQEIKMENYLKNLKKINWLRCDPLWYGRTIVNGKIAVKKKNVNLTFLEIKELIGIELSSAEKEINEMR